MFYSKYFEQYLDLNIESVNFIKKTSLLQLLRYFFVELM